MHKQQRATSTYAPSYKCGETLMCLMPFHQSRTHGCGPRASRRVLPREKMGHPLEPGEFQVEVTRPTSRSLFLFWMHDLRATASCDRRGHAAGLANASHMGRKKNEEIRIFLLVPRRIQRVSGLRQLLCCRMSFLGRLKVKFPHNSGHIFTGLSRTKVS